MKEPPTHTILMTESLEQAPSSQISKKVAMESIMLESLRMISKQPLKAKKKRKRAPKRARTRKLNSVGNIQRRKRRNQKIIPSHIKIC